MFEASCGFGNLLEMALCMSPILIAVGFLKLGLKWRKRG